MEFISSYDAIWTMCKLGFSPFMNFGTRQYNQSINQSINQSVNLSIKPCKYVKDKATRTLDSLKEILLMPEKGTAHEYALFVS